MNNAVECRTCLDKIINQPQVNVESFLTEQKSVLQAIQEIASIQVTANDILPKQICQECFKLLKSAALFRSQVIRSHLTLKSRQEHQLEDPLFLSCDAVEQVHIKEGEKSKTDIKEEVLLVRDNKQQCNGQNDCKQGEKFKTLSDDEKGNNDWLDSNNVNDYSSSDNLFQEKSRKESYGVKKYKVKPREIKTRKKRTLKRKQRPLQTDTSSDGDSDVPLEELRKEIKYEGSKASVKGKAKRDDAEEPRLCPICGKLFKAKQNFNSHMTTVHRKKPDKPDKISCLCPDCGRVITGTRQNFVAHRRYHHSDKAQVKKRFTCDVCPRKFYREKNLIIHERIHKGEKGYVCELCPDKSYTQIGGLILHRRKVHLKKPSCTCNYCGKQFYEKHYLETHIRQWHTGERPFSCEICGKAFSCNGTLLRHRKDSHGEKKPCPKCGKMYTEGELRKHLKRHKIREEGIKRKKFTCEYCRTEMNFTSRKRHLLKQHGIMLRGRGENAERVPITRADAM